MKVLKYSLLVVLAIFIAKCSPDDDGAFGDPIDRTQQLMGTWTIQSVSQIDLDAEKKSFPDFATTVDITNLVANMPFSDFSLTMDNQSITTVLGNSPMAYVIQGGSGTWEWISDAEIDLVQEELGIQAVSGIKTTINGQDVNLYMTTFTGLNATNALLSLSYERLDNQGGPVMRYEYVLAKQ